jgi:hypothetical protein
LVHLASVCERKRIQHRVAGVSQASLRFGSPPVSLSTSGQPLCQRSPARGRTVASIPVPFPSAFSPIGTAGSRPPCPHNFLGRCSHLLTADLQAHEAFGLQGLPAGIEELAVALDCIADEAQDYKQFEGLERFRCLRKLAYRSLVFEAGRQSEQCAKALSQIPASVQHLAFDNVLVSTFLDELAPLLRNRRWLPSLKTLSVASAADEQMVRPDVEEACASRHINYRAFDVDEDYADVPEWNASPWL